VCRNASTFEPPEDLLGFISCMSDHESFGGHPIRIENMVLYDEERAKVHFHFRVVIVNWLYTPELTYDELLNYVLMDDVVASTNGREGSVRLLLAGPDIKVNLARTDDGNTPLLMAISYGHAKVLELSLGYPEIDVNLPDLAL
jgi:hypothetical protein